MSDRFKTRGEASRLALIATLVVSGCIPEIIESASRGDEVGNTTTETGTDSNNTDTSTDSEDTGTDVGTGSSDSGDTGTETGTETGEPECGNGVVEAGEACDDGINDGGYEECGPSCTVEEYCGDGMVNGPEQCEEGEACDTSLCEWTECALIPPAADDFSECVNCLMGKAHECCGALQACFEAPDTNICDDMVDCPTEDVNQTYANCVTVLDNFSSYANFPPLLECLQNQRDKTCLAICGYPNN